MLIFIPSTSRGVAVSLPAPPIGSYVTSIAHFFNSLRGASLLPQLPQTPGENGSRECCPPRIACISKEERSIRRSFRGFFCLFEVISANQRFGNHIATRPMARTLRQKLSITRYGRRWQQQCSFSLSFQCQIPPSTFPPLPLPKFKPQDSTGPSAQQARKGAEGRRRGEPFTGMINRCWLGRFAFCAAHK